MESLVDKIRESERVLIAIGKELETVSIDKDAPWESALKVYGKQNDGMIEFYNDIAKLVSGKDYFVANLCCDGNVYKSQLNPLRIVTPCGNYDKLQCKCEENIQDAISYYKRNVQPECEVCKSVMIPNVYGVDGYNENGYLKQWRLYNIWLQHSLSKKLLVIELGMDFTIPNVLRWPLERVVFIGNNATMIRISEKYFQCPEELAGKVISISTNPVEYIGEMCHG